MADIGHGVQYESQTFFPSFASGDSAKDLKIENLTIYYTECSLNIVFFSNVLKYIPDSGHSRFFLGVSVSGTMAGQTPALQQDWQSSEKSQHFKENTIFNEHPVSV